jgi:hypothetical protein
VVTPSVTGLLVVVPARTSAATTAQSTVDPKLPFTLSDAGDGTSRSASEAPAIEPPLPAQVSAISLKPVPGRWSRLRIAAATKTSEFVAPLVRGNA